VYGLNQAAHDGLLLVPDQGSHNEMLFPADRFCGGPFAEVEFFRVQADHRTSMEQSAKQAWIFTGMALLGVVIFGYATGVLMGPYVPVIGERLPELTCLQLAFTGARAAEVLGSFSPEQRTAIAGLLIPGDVVFAWGYGFLLTGLLGLLTLRLPATWQRPGKVLMWTPLLASTFDCLEDLALYQLAVAPAGSDLGLVPLLAGIAATLKYLNLSLLAPAYGIAGSIRGLAHDRRVGALLIYVLVVVNALAFFAKPATEIPACF